MTKTIKVNKNNTDENKTENIKDIKSNKVVRKYTRILEKEKSLLKLFKKISRKYIF